MHTTDPWERGVYKGEKVVLQRGGQSENAVSMVVSEGGRVACELQQMQREAEVHQRVLKIRGSRYASICTDHLPQNTQQGHDIRLIARFRLQNEEQGLQNWRTEKTCRICREPTETMKHVLANCAKMRGGIC